MNETIRIPPFCIILGFISGISSGGDIPRPILDLAKKENLVFAVPNGNLDSGLASYLETRKDTVDPFSIAIDINGDGKDDYFSILRSHGSLKMVCAYSRGKSYRLVIIDDLGEDKDIRYHLSPIPPGLIRGYGYDGIYTQADSVQAGNPSVKLNRFGNFNSIYFWKDGRLEAWMFTGD